jgi:hypothetical protein
LEQLYYLEFSRLKYKSTDVSEEHIPPIFRVKIQAKQETSMKQVASSAEVRQETSMKLHAHFLIGLFIYSKDGSSLFL